MTTGTEGTAQAATELAKSLVGGEVIALVGDLGSGKTTFTAALGKALGVVERMTSPTFVLMHTHALPEGPIRMFIHADAWRTDTAGLRGVGLDEFIGAPGIVVVIEWADRVPDLLPPETIKVTLHNLGGDRRDIRIERS